MTQITATDRARLLALINVYADAARKAAYAEEAGCIVFGTVTECRAREDAAYGELGELVYGWTVG